MAFFSRKTRRGTKVIASRSRCRLQLETLEDRSVPASAGALDPTFGVGGRVLSDFGGEQHRALAIQADGKVVTLGSTYNFDSSRNLTVGYDSHLTRYNPDGSLDATFGSGGRITVLGTAELKYRRILPEPFNIPVDPYYDASYFDFNSLGVQADGRIIVSGYTFQGDTSFDNGQGPVYEIHLAVARYNADGSPDVSFGTDGKVVGGFDGSNSFGETLAIQADGRIVVAGSAYSAPSLVRFNANGSLDASFDTDGVATTNFGASAVAIRADGGIVLAGTTWSDSGISRFGVVRYNADGSPDTTFGTEGRVVTDFDALYPDSLSPVSQSAQAMALQADGKIVVGGYAYDDSFCFDFALARYNADGSPDSGFGSDGRVVSDFGTSDEGIQGLGVQTDGRIVAAGYSWQGNGTFYDFALARYEIDGTLDASFGTGGKVTTDFPSSEFGSGEDGAADLALQADGKIVAAGWSLGSSTGYGPALVRYQGFTDTDDDGIADAVDTQPTTYSNDFADGTTSGTITNRGDQTISIVDATDPTQGVLITASFGGGPTPADISVVDGTAALSVRSGARLTATRGSVILDVLSGTVGARFVADTGAIATANLPAGTGLTFQPDTFTFMAAATNTQTVQVLVNGSGLAVAPGQTARSVQIDVKPGDDSNSQNLASNGVISVATLSTAGFDARSINVSSLVFAGAHAASYHFDDVNGDGLLDLVAQFRTQETTLRSLYEHLLADDITEHDGVLDSSHETATVALSGLCQDGTGFLGTDSMDLFLSGKALRDMLTALAAAGVI